MILICAACIVRCLILRNNGELSLLDLDDGHEQVLTNSVELFWVTCGHSEDKENLIEEVSWLDYGHRGMQVNAFIVYINCVIIFLFFGICVNNFSFMGSLRKKITQITIELIVCVEVGHCRCGIHLLEPIHLNRRIFSRY